MTTIAPPPTKTASTWREHHACTWDWATGSSTATCVEHQAVFELPTEEEAWDL
jgi:hypothetical protein